MVDPVFDFDLPENLGDRFKWGPISNEALSNIPVGYGVVDGNLVIRLKNGTEASFGPLPVAPGGDDPGIAGYINTPGSQSGMAVDARVTAAVDALVDGAPGALDTLEELAAALGDDPNFATTVTTALANRVRFDAAQTLTAPQQTQARTNIGAASTAQGTKADTAVQPGSLAPVATSGTYTDLTGRPTLGTAAAQDTTAFAPASHTHTADQISDSTSTGRAVVTAASQAAARTAIGAGTSSLTIGTTASTAKAGNYQPTAANISDATTIGRNVLTAATAAAARTAIGAASDASVAVTFPAILGTKVGFIGDSYTAGLTLASPTTTRWTKVFSDGAGVAEANVAVSGAGYLNEGAGGNSRFSKQAALLPTDCTHVIIMGGINDAPIFQVSTLTAAVQDTITAVRTRIPGVTITVLSPQWMPSAPSGELLAVESVIRAALPADITYVENGPWLRIDRDDLTTSGDTHPNIAGHQVIAAYVRDAMIGKPQPGARFGSFVRPGTGDAAFTTTDTSLVSGTIYNAAPGWWELEGAMSLYGVVNGHAFVKTATTKWRIRSDILSGSQPTQHRHKARFFHPGGNLVIHAGYDVSTGTANAMSAGNTRVWARRID